MNARSAARAAAELEADRRRIAADHAARNPGEIPFDATPAPVRRVVMATRLNGPTKIDQTWAAFKRRVEAIDGYGMRGDRD